MKLGELKEWINSKPESEMDCEIAVASHIFPPKEYIQHIVHIGYYGASDEFRGYLLMVLTDRELELVEKLDKTERKLREVQEE